MDCKSKKYLHIYDWNYWWGYYRCGKDCEPFHSAEFSLTEDEAGKVSFFHFDFNNLSALHQTIRDGEFVEPDSPDHPSFLEQAKRLRNGEQDWFIGALYYPLFSPEMRFCNASVRSGVPLTKLLSPSVPPYYGVIFLREERPLTPEVLMRWVEALSHPCSASSFPARLRKSPADRRPWSSLRMRCGRAMKCTIPLTPDFPLKSSRAGCGRENRVPITRTGGTRSPRGR